MEDEGEKWKRRKGKRKRSRRGLRRRSDNGEGDDRVRIFFLFLANCPSLFVCDEGKMKWREKNAVKINSSLSFAVFENARPVV